MTWHFTFEMQITHSHLTVYIWGTHSTLSPHSIHLNCRYRTPTLQYTSQVQIPPSHLTGLSKVHLMVYIWGADTRLLPYSIYYMCIYHLLNLQYTSDVLIPPSHLQVYTLTCRYHSHLTVYISYANVPRPIYHIHTPELQISHCHLTVYIWGTDTTKPFSMSVSVCKTPGDSQLVTMYFMRHE